MSSKPSLFVRELGSGNPVVLIHGCPTDPDHLLPLAERLASAHRCLVVHLPGYGKSPPLEVPEAELFARTQALIEEALLARGAPEVEAVGYSGGAYRALALALGGRIRVRRLALLAGYAGFAPAHRETLIGVADLVRRGELEAALPRGLSAGMLSPAFAAAHPEAAREVDAWASAVPPAFFATELASMARAENLLPALGRLEAPVLARVGELDQAAPLPYSEAIARACPSSSLEVAPGVAHAILLEDFEATSASVARWLAA